MDKDERIVKSIHKKLNEEEYEWLVKVLKIKRTQNKYALFDLVTTLAMPFVFLFMITGLLDDMEISMSVSTHLLLGAACGLTTKFIRM